MQSLVAEAGASVLSSSFRNAAYLRVASVAVGAYELICTLPAEYLFYRAQSFRNGLSQQCFLFVLIRYFSIAVIVMSNLGFFGHFSSEDCQRFLLVSPILKALQTLVSQLILCTRTYYISRRSRWVFWMMLGMLVLSVTLEFFSDIFKRSPVQNPLTLNCTSGNASARIAWINYAVVMMFDLVAICISTGYLWIYSTLTVRISHFIQTLLYEGLGYFVALTEGVNIFNLVLYLKGSEATQSSGASLGYVITFILSQRILIRQREYAEKYSEATTSHEVTRALDTTREINNALRSQFESVSAVSRTANKSSPFGVSFAIATLRSAATSTFVPILPSSACESTSGYARDAEQDAGASSSELNVRVRIEQTVIVERNPAALLREDYRHPRVMWDHGTRPPEVRSER